MTTDFSTLTFNCSGGMSLLSIGKSWKSTTGRFRHFYGATTVSPPPTRSSPATATTTLSPTLSHSFSGESQTQKSEDVFQEIINRNPPKKNTGPRKIPEYLIALNGVPWDTRSTNQVDHGSLRPCSQQCMLEQLISCPQDHLTVGVC